MHKHSTKARPLSKKKASRGFSRPRFPDKVIIETMKFQVVTQEELARQARKLGERRPLAVTAGLAAARGLQVYLVGGTVRELLLGRPVQDLDLAVDRQTLELAQELARVLGGTYVLLNEAERSARVVWQREEIDLTEFRASTLAADLQLRDFTVNALAIPLTSLYRPGPVPVIDPWGGLTDLAAGRLQLLLPENFRTDPLRLLRAFRFAATHGFVLAPELAAVIRSYGSLIQAVPGERVRAELFRLLAVPQATPIITEMDRLGFLEQLFPELADLKGVPQNGYHHLDVWGHTLATLANLETVAAEPQRYFNKCAATVAAYAAVPEKMVLLKLAALFHDAGKPKTAAYREDKERYTFYFHDRVGVEIFTCVAERLRLSGQETRTVTLLISLHMRPFLLLPAFRQGTLRPGALGRYIKAAKKELAGTWLLAMADSLAGQGPQKPADAEEALAAFCDAVYTFWQEKYRPFQRQPRLLTGHDLIRQLHLQPGPLFRRLLAAVEEAALEGRVRNREEALELVRKLVARQPAAT